MCRRQGSKTKGSASLSYLFYLQTKTQTYTGNTGQVMFTFVYDGTDGWRTYRLCQQVVLLFQIVCFAINILRFAIWYGGACVVL